MGRGLAWRDRVFEFVYTTSTSEENITSASNFCILFWIVPSKTGCINKVDGLAREFQGGLLREGRCGMCLWGRGREFVDGTSGFAED